MSAKYRQLADILRSELRQIARQGGGKLETEAHLCQRYHMSRQTVRHALNLLEEEGLIQRRQGSGSYVMPQPDSSDPRQIAVITTYLDDYFFPSILHDAQSVFSDAGYATLIFATENQVNAERDILQKLLSQPVSAILVEGSKTALPTPNSDLYEQLRQEGVPVLFLHSVYTNLQDFPCMLEDNYAGGYQLARYLIRKGHTKIAGFFKSDDLQGPQRYYGVVSALREARLPILDRCFFWYDTIDRETLVNSQDLGLLDRFLRCLPDATAVICYNDELAQKLIRKLLEAGKRVPEDMAVVSFDNSYCSQIGPVPITSLGHKATRIGKSAARLLLDILSGVRTGSMVLEWELNERESG